MTGKNHSGKDYLTAGEVRRLLNAPNINTYIGARNRMLLMLAIDSGIGQAEIVRLKCEDLNLKRKTVYISGRKKRTVTLSKKTCKYITQYIDEIRPKSESPNLFLTSKGTPTNQNELKRILFRASRHGEFKYLVEWRMLQNTYTKNQEVKK